MADYSNKRCMIVDLGLFTELGVTLSASFGEVLYWTPWASPFPKSNSRIIGEGLAPNMHRIQDIWAYLDTTDLFVFPDVGDGGLQVHLRNIGKRVWGSGYGEELEMFRPESKRHLKSVGIPVYNWKIVKGIDNLRSYLKVHDNVWVKVSTVRGDFESFKAVDYKNIEPKIDELEYRLGAKGKHYEFVVEDGIDDAVEVGWDGYCIDGKYPTQVMYGVESKDKGYIGHFQAYDKGPEPILEVNAKIAPTLAKYQYRNNWALECRITKDGTPWAIDPCFSEDTEILTENGWKLFPDLENGESVATLNVKTNQIEYQKPIDYIASRFDGGMIRIANSRSTIDCLVTPNHMVWRTDRHGEGLFTERADSLTDKGYIPRTGEWRGVEAETFTLPAYFKRWNSGLGNGIWKEKDCPPIDIPMDVWLEFLALFLSEGSLRGPWAVSITQTKYRDEMREMLQKMPFTLTEDRHGFILSSVQLAHYLKDSGLCNTKRIPRYVKDLTPEQISVFLDAYLMGDGGTHKGQRSYFTTSEGMANDLQELIFHAGRLANIRKMNTKGTIAVINGKKYARRYDIYWVGECAKQTKFWFETACRKDQYITEVPYSGMVFDVTVPNHTVYVRRKGKPFWSSNCCRFGAPPNELQQVMYTNLADIIWEGAGGNCIDPIPADEYGAELLIHSSFADQNWQAITIPEDIRKYVKLRNCTKIDGEYYVVPQAVGLPEIGAVVATGPTIEAAVNLCKERASKIEGYCVETFDDCLEDVNEQIEKLNEFGIKF